jgi:hypothetical protein
MAQPTLDVLPVGCESDRVGGKNEARFDERIARAVGLGPNDLSLLKAITGARAPVCGIAISAAIFGQDGKRRWIAEVAIPHDLPDS